MTGFLALTRAANLHPLRLYAIAIKATLKAKWIFFRRLAWHLLHLGRILWIAFAPEHAQRLYKIGLDYILGDPFAAPVAPRKPTTCKCSRQPMPLARLLACLLTSISI